MSALSDEIAEALLEVESLLEPEQITFYVTGTAPQDSVAVPCVPTMLTESDQLLVGGMDATDGMALNVRTGHFITADSTEITVDSDLFTADNSKARPRAEKRCSFRGIDWRIATAGEDATRAYMHLVLVRKNSRR